MNTIRTFLFVLAAALLGACGGGSTSLRSELLSANYHGPPKHILVFAFGMNQGSKLLAENNLAEHLTLAGVRTSKGQEVFGELLDIDREYILRRLRRTDIDALLVLRLDRVQIESKQEYRPQLELGDKSGLQLISEADITGANTHLAALGKR